MRIGGLQKVSLIDYPGKICAIVFTQGCNFRCPYCHNPELVDPNLFGECESEDGLMSFLEKRKGKLDAVSITGGEPTIQQDLIAFVRRLKNIGYFVKIDTNGSNPEVMHKIIDGKLIDYIAMDIKAPLKKYKTVTQSNIDDNKILQSIEMIMTSGIPYEFRTTVLKSKLTAGDILEIGKIIKNASLYVLQSFIASKTLDQSCLSEATYSLEEMEVLKEKLLQDINSVMIR
ncbi:MAG: anaerobic ribonucleoside-triphosphate reductase activating protein [Deltaproteobacteria bacterium]|nr:anaerobic ribonucleoside-triphosphate reductase activating protein [Deltaproteobacteria bacterium]